MGVTIGVLGVSGGVGASTLTATLAMRAHSVLDSCLTSVAIDLDPRGGLDTTMCLEHLDGLRWPDLELQSWTEPGPEVVVTQLPGEDGAHVLTGGGVRLPDWPLVAEMLDAFAVQCDLIAVDCGTRPPPRLLSRLDLLVLLTRTTARGLADLQVLDEACTLGRTESVLITRGPKTAGGVGASARVIGPTAFGHLPDDPRVARHADEGSAPGVLRSACDSVADELLAMVESHWLTELMSRAGTAGRGA